MLKRDFVHTTRDGTKIRIKDLENDHLMKIIDLYERKAKTGFEVRTGGLDAYDCWMDVDILYGDDALDAMGHPYYIQEAKRRGLVKHADGNIK